MKPLELQCFVGPLPCKLGLVYICAHQSRPFADYASIILGKIVAFKQKELCWKEPFLGKLGTGLQEPNCRTGVNWYNLSQPQLSVAF